MNALYAVLSFSTSGRFMKVVATFHPGSNSANISSLTDDDEVEVEVEVPRFLADDVHRRIVYYSTCT